MHNPVDWYPWGREALDRAAAEDKPLFVSIGYSACHWCHVMEHESFEDPATAALMNELFVCIKVDREERPDLDQIYMDAVTRWWDRAVGRSTRFLQTRWRAVLRRHLFSAGAAPRHARPSAVARGDGRRLRQPTR